MIALRLRRFRRWIDHVIRWSMLAITILVIGLSVTDRLGMHFYWGTTPVRLQGTFLTIYDGALWFQRDRSMRMFVEEWIKCPPYVPTFSRDVFTATPPGRPYLITNDCVVLRSLWLCIALTLFTAWLWRPEAWRIRSRGSPGHCHACGYAMTGLDRKAPCPECGSGAAV